MMIADTILPSNKDRGYILRKLLRRAIYNGYLLNIKDTFLSNIVDVVSTIYKDADGFEHLNNLDYIKSIINAEEIRFHNTLNLGLKLLNKQMNNGINGNFVFKLYDTYGFPKELTTEILSEHNIIYNEDEFNFAMEEQRNRSRMNKG